ncbi:hypothetical protein HMPREF0198_0999 [Cardiobacterium hominis ATCC 15826]|uniref:adenosine kinase n=1 Tax=Cardiobacterium hominis (strain ATCC 15826 / DSM 8339 / NCTC 10426 / 6573) TaxID=638300 RepID=C8N921_CARH6|nr:PfkB family carbohydrate kinase [Cardiobacterium hominis]EEV88860.1 hypothetical protein HMPREF0198_0999 [Cardiobacterium hominis ATCC 15826]
MFCYRPAYCLFYSSFSAVIRKRIRVAGEHVAQVIDTTSAGDAFNAGFLARYLQDADPAACCRAGNRLAAIVIQHKGAIIPAEHCQLAR